MIVRATRWGLPAFIQYTDDLPDYVDGRRWLGPCVKIRPKCKDDEPLHQHEMDHVLLWYQTLGLLPLFKLLSRRFAIHIEARAYKRMLAFYPEDDTPDKKEWRVAVGSRPSVQCAL